MAESDHQILTRKHRNVSIGDLDRRINLHSRVMQEPVFNGTDFSEKFDPTDETWALIRTVSGKAFFSGSNIDVSVSHEVYIRYDSSVSAETWIEYESRLFDIVAVEDLEERHEFMRLLCTERGNKSLGASQA